MCEIRIETLTLATLLDDPLTRMVMQSDGVTAQDLAEVWARVAKAAGVAERRHAEPVLA